jgi:NAD(P)-dependent dehydrogenase (short-subunit alcohol dehydrogenase family)
MKRALITGASRGIGRAAAASLAEEGYHIILQGRDEEALLESSRLVAQQGSTAEAIKADLSNPEAIDSLMQIVGDKPLELLVNNAGIANAKPLPEITLEEWQKVFAVNVTAPFLLTQKCLTLMNQGGTIVNVLSTAARTPFANWSAYCMSKYALEGFTQSIKAELRSQGIRVINIYPAAVDTDIWEQVPGDWPREKMMKPEEVAEAIRYAVSRPASVLVEEIAVGGIAGNL